MKTRISSFVRRTALVLGFGIVLADALTGGGCSAWQAAAPTDSAKAAKNAAKVIDGQHQGMEAEITAWNAANPTDKVEAAYSPPNIFSTEPTGYFAASTAKAYSDYGSKHDEANWESVRTGNLTIVNSMYALTTDRLAGAINAATQSGSAVTQVEKDQITDMRRAALRLAEYAYIYEGWTYNAANPEPDANVMRVRTLRLKGFVAPQIASLDGTATEQPAAALAASTPAPKPDASAPTGGVTRKDLNNAGKDVKAVGGVVKAVKGLGG